MTNLHDTIHVCCPIYMYIEHTMSYTMYMHAYMDWSPQPSMQWQQACTELERAPHCKLGTYVLNGPALMSLIRLECYCFLKAGY